MAVLVLLRTGCGLADRETHPITPTGRHRRPGPGDRRVRGSTTRSSNAARSTRLGPPRLDRTHPGAAASLREGLDETLTVLRLGVPPSLARTLRSTNSIESMISVCREHAANVKRWRDGQMALRWCAAGMIEAGKQFRRVNGHLHLPVLRAALERHVAGQVGPVMPNDQEHAA